MRKKQDLGLKDRPQHLFKKLVERYIIDGQPVGSRTLARDVNLDLSPATIRNVMADLEEMGLIASPHTSAGRIPTVKGYRLFVDQMVRFKNIPENEMQKIQEQLENNDSVDSLLSKTSLLLSEITHMAGLVMVPFSKGKALRQVEFLSLNDNRVLVILVTNDSEVENRIIKTKKTYSQSALTQAANYLTSAFAGRDISAVKQGLIQEMSEARREMYRLMDLVIEMSQKALVSEEGEKDYVLAGQTNLMNIYDPSEMSKLRNLFEAFNQKQDILHLLDQATNAAGVQVFIGEESGYQPLDDCTVVTSTYSSEHKVLGVLGVIGPTRMEYERVIPIVDLTAKMLTAALKSKN